MKLRDYQRRFVDGLRAAYAAGHRAPLGVSPTGSGKTVIAAEIIRAARARNRRVLFLAHKIELINQSRDKLERAGIYDVRVIRAAQDSGTAADAVAVASVPTLAQKRWRDRMPAADLVIFDECHHVKAETWSSIAAHYADSHLLGLTATPQRSDGAALGDIFDSLVVGSTVRELTDLGHLVPCRVWAPEGPLETGQTALTPLEAYQQFAGGQRAVIFCATLPHAESIAAEMSSAGIPTAAVHGSLPAAERARRLESLASGEIRAVTSLHVLTEGWDLPAVAVCILARKPQHAGTFLQMVGRVLRPSPGKTHAMLVDLCGSVHLHGTPDMDREYSLDGKGIKSTDRDQLRQCPTCGAVFLAPATACPQCGAEMPRSEKAEPKSIGVGLVELTGVQKQQLRDEQLMRNLWGAARRSRRSASWVQRAHAAISQRWLP